MHKLQIEFESTGYNSWINSDLYPDGKIYTKEYTEWLEIRLSIIDLLFISRVISLLGECVEGNDYEILADKDGRFWINHKVIGSGEPFAQFLETALKLEVDNPQT